MELITFDDDVKEILIEDIVKSNDKGKVIVKGEEQGKRDEGKDNLTKEIIALDTMNIGPTAAAEVHGVGKDSASKYSRGEDIADDDTRARVLGAKHNIADKAVAQLMDTLNLFDPRGLEKQSDIIKAAGALASIVEKVSSGPRGNGQEVHLHLYGPKQNKIDKYDVIDV